MMGPETNHDMTDLELVMANEENENEQDQPIKTTIYINIDEDDDNKKNVDLNEIFKNQGNDKPFSVEVSPFILFLFSIF